MTDLLDLPGWRVLCSTLERGTYNISAAYEHEPSACMKCGVVGRLYRHGTKSVEYRDVHIRGNPVRLDVKVRRYRCRECNETFLQPMAHVEEGRRMTVRCADYIRSRCLRQTFTQIAEDVGCSEGTVRAIADAYVTQRSAEYVPTIPRYMGIDETMLDGKMRLVITDVANRCPVDIQPAYDSNTLRRWLMNHKPTSSLVCVTTDMNQAYHSVVGELFPGVPVVVDKFHLLKEANIGLETTRKRIQATKTPQERRSWKRSRHQLLMRPDRLADFQALNLDGWLSNEPEVAMAYKVKERLFSLYDLPRDAASREYDAFVAEFPKELKADFKALLSKMRNWRKQILAYFDYPITNGYTEAMNGIAKVKNRLGRGYGFDVIRARILFGKDYEPQDWPVVDGPILRKSLLASQMGKCSSCGGDYPREELYFVQAGVGAPLDDPLRGKELMCGECKSRFHTDGTHFKGSLCNPDSTH